MNKKKDGLIWGMLKCNDLAVEMLWNSGASITVMSEEIG